LVDGARLAVGSLSLEFLHTPGHCPDHLAIFLPQFQLALTGDLLFVGKVGGTQSDEDATLEWESLQRLLKYFPAETTLWPGHDYGCRPSSSLSLERFTNPFLLCPNLAAFLSLKRNWSSFKADHGLK
jgi:glyoxylase-like metal-dependent hydrolase (beta-lactamase superfamily II)